MIHAGLLLGVLVLLPATVDSQDQPPFKVAVRVAPPFGMRDAAGEWSGLSVELWKEVAEKIDVEFEWVEMPLDETLESLENGEIGAAVTALTVTAEREERFDFSHPYYVSGLSLAYKASTDTAWKATLKGLMSSDFLRTVGTLLLVLLGAGGVLWFFERKRNAAQFGEGNTVRGLGDGFWWSAVTMTTVGYGDKAPVTFGGRVVALIWMFASLFFVASLTASIAASLTANRLASSFLLSSPLSELRVGVLDQSAAHAFALRQGANPRTYPDVDAALDGIQYNEVQVVLHDAPILKYFVREGQHGLDVSPQILVRDDYGFGLPQGSPIRERVNAALLSILQQPSWPSLLKRHLGDTDSQ